MAILDAALALFKERGFRVATMRDIAVKTLMAVGATYYHFLTKEVIFFAPRESTQDRSEKRARRKDQKTERFASRILDITEFKLDKAW